MSESRLRVPDMSCDACRATVEGTLEPLPGVDAVDVDLDSKVVTVRHDAGQAAVEQLAGAIEDDGDEVTERQAA
jgi:copper chaperone